QLAPVDGAGGREQPPPAADGLDRPLPDPPLGSRHRPRGDAGRTDRPPARGKDRLLRLLDLPTVGDRRSAVGRRAAWARPVRLRAATVPPADPGDREGRSAPL